MQSAATFMCVLASSSLWLTGSGLVLWLCLRSRLRLSPGTRAAASILIVLQGWIWIGIPVELDNVAQIDPAWFDSGWIDSTWAHPQPTGIPSQQATPIDAAEGATPLPFHSALPIAASSMPDIMPMAGAAASAIWIAGIAIILGRSIYGIVTLSRMVQT